MDEAELAQRLGEAFRLYSYQIANGAIAPFRKLLTDNHIEVTLYFNGETIVVTPKPEEKPVEKDLYHIPPRVIGL